MSTTTIAPPEPDICEIGGKGLLLPIFGDDEQAWPKEARAIIYFVVLCWCFLGVSIIADIFMGGIEAVTSKRKTRVLGNGQTVTLKVWNGTVANLTLMALGSSAPEILLNVIEILKNNFYAGELGPSCIVGSAAFNLLVIIAICIYVIPSDDARTIRAVEPFLVTAVFAVFAYLWLIIVLGLHTPDFIDLWEGVTTFLFFPVLVVLAYCADVGMFNKSKAKKAQEEEMEVQNTMLEAGVPMDSKDAKLLVQAQREQDESKNKSKAARRAEQVAMKVISPQELSVGFVTRRYCFHEDLPELMLEIEKVGTSADDYRVGVEYATHDGNMMSSVGHYTTHKGYLEIAAGQKFAQATITRNPEAPKLASFEQDLKQDVGKASSIKSKKPNVDSGTLLEGGTESRGPSPQAAFFFLDIVQCVKLNGSDVARRTSTSVAPNAVREDIQKAMQDITATKVNILPDYRRARIAISSVKGSGRLRFEKPQTAVEGPLEPVQQFFKVRRFNGTEGELRCSFKCEPGSAKPNFDYEHTDGELVFGPGEEVQEIEVTILKKNAWENPDEFYILLGNVDEDNPALEENSAIMSVLITCDKAKGMADKVLRVMDKQINFDAFSEGNKDWKVQFISAFRPHGGDVDDMEAASAADWTIHVVALPWKVLFAFVPPPIYCGGWLCFGIALAMIGGVTALIGDLASLLGCVIGLKPGITAITIVAVGTSLPDAFASKVAATEDDCADNAIGNVTGSNSVNVFLGIGMPWMVACIFWTVSGPTDEWRRRYPQSAIDYPDGGFVVIAGDLVFSVIVFTLAGLAALTLLWYRRATFQAELGGPEGAKINSCVFLVLLWLFYIGLACWKIEAGPQSTGRQCIAIFIGMVFVVVGMLVVSGVITFFKSRRHGMHEDIKTLLAAVKTQNNEEVSLQRLGSMNTGEGRNSQAAFGALPAGCQNMSSEKILERLKDQIAGLSAIARALESSMQKSIPAPIKQLVFQKEKIDAESGATPSSEEAYEPPGTNGSTGENVTEVGSPDGAAGAKNVATMRRLGSTDSAAASVQGSKPAAAAAKTKPKRFRQKTATGSPSLNPVEGPGPQTVAE